MAQLLNQAYYLKTFPAVRAAVLDRVERVFVEMKHAAQSGDFLLSVILIPTKWDVEPSPLMPVLDEIVTLLGLSRRDLQSASEAGSELKRRLEREGILCWDPASEMKRRQPPFFWSRDFHLNVTGHRLLAELYAAGPVHQLLNAGTRPPAAAPGR